MENLTLAKVISLAVVDAVNPCAFAVLTMLLISIIAYNPHKKINIIWAGFAFSLAVFIMYLLYGLFIIKSFQLVQGITTIRPYLYKGLGIAAVLLGLFQIRDFVAYKIGGFGTEMPVTWRPKVKAVISKATSPAGAFIVGLFVTLFLLPCTIGPYIILGGLLSVAEILKSLPFLLLYNVIFILPMLIITLVVYMGLSRVEDVQDWKDKNIRILHLVAGILMAGLGVAMIGEWI
ncbi:MAG: cytochrome c biogenesis CcdA family protein [Bdellovibrionales bacterium]